VGGFAVDRQPAPLPADLERFMEGSGDAGVIVVSFGTLVRHYGPHWTRLFAAAFARLPQRVVWRHYGNETSANDTTFGYDDRLDDDDYDDNNNDDVMAVHEYVQKYNVSVRPFVSQQAGSYGAS